MVSAPRISVLRYVSGAQVTFAGVSGKGFCHNCEPALQSAHTTAATMHASVAGWMAKTSDAPIFHPTQEEWENPMAFIRSIRPQAELAGERLRTLRMTWQVRSVTLPALSERLPTPCRHLQNHPSNNGDSASIQGECPSRTSPGCCDTQWLASWHCGLIKLSLSALQVIRGPNDETLQFHVRHQPLAAQPTASLDAMRFETSAEYVSQHPHAYACMSTYPLFPMLKDVFSVQAFRHEALLRPRIQEGAEAPRRLWRPCRRPGRGVS